MLTKPEPDPWCASCRGKCPHAYGYLDKKRYCSRACLDEGKKLQQEERRQLASRYIHYSVKKE